MRILNIIAACILSCLMSLPSGARNRDDFQRNDLGVTVGVNLPMYKDMGSELTTGISYGHFNDKGIGFRAGVQFTPVPAKTGNSFGLPVAFSYRTRTPWSGNSWMDGAYSSGSGYDDYWQGGGTSSEGSFGDFLRHLFRNAEFMAGITPGYVSGEYSMNSQVSKGNGGWSSKWTEFENHFSLSIDAGISLNYSLWRFDLKLMPAFHYNLTDNYFIMRSKGDYGRGGSDDSMTPVRWFFSLNGGLVFRF